MSAELAASIDRLTVALNTWAPRLIEAMTGRGADGSQTPIAPPLVPAPIKETRKRDSRGRWAPAVETDQLPLLLPAQPATSGAPAALMGQTIPLPPPGSACPSPEIARAVLLAMQQALGHNQVAPTPAPPQVAAEMASHPPPAPAWPTNFRGPPPDEVLEDDETDPWVDDPPEVASAPPKVEETHPWARDDGEVWSPSKVARELGESLPVEKPAAPPPPVTGHPLGWHLQPHHGPVAPPPFVVPVLPDWRSRWQP